MMSFPITMGFFVNLAIILALALFLMPFAVVRTVSSLSLYTAVMAAAVMAVTMPVGHDRRAKAPRQHNSRHHDYNCSFPFLQYFHLEKPP